MLTLLGKLINNFGYSTAIIVIIILLSIKVFNFLLNYLTFNRAQNVKTLDKIINYMQKPLNEWNSFVIEQLFLNHYRIALTYDEIVFFLSSSCPTLNLNKYINAKSWLKFDNLNCSLIVKNKPNLNNKIIYLKIYKCFYIIFFIISTLTASFFVLDTNHFLEIINSQNFLKNTPVIGLVMWGVMIFLMYFIGFIFIDASEILNTAIDLISNFEGVNKSGVFLYIVGLLHSIPKYIYFSFFKKIRANQ